MLKTINVAQAQQLTKPIYIDMRSPSEFIQGHIPGAFNIPLFTDAERAEVGTVYKQKGTEDAKHLGLTLVSAKLPDLVRQIRDFYQSGRTVIIYCWRGGMRSKSVVSVLDLMGIQSFQLLGGYKAYRNYVLETLRGFELKPRIIVLCGSTGVGKTTLLKELIRRQAPVIDLERLANHRGSAFGHVGLGPPATAQNFDAEILQELQRLNDQPYILVECESKRIGNVYVPDALFEGMKKGIRILIRADMDTRVNRLIEEYTDIYNKNLEAILRSIKTLERKLGRKRTDKMLTDIQAGRMAEVVKTLLTDYYDPLYGYEKADPASYDLVVCANDLNEAADRIMEYLKTIRG
ncbi:MAG: tRNA 2-selenouridine(34) synthase MnmH [Negativicutes bacterium]|nr:tRNA 2-selenouridine(34) synthase MnmH [Negativicutes bacterium]